MTRYLPAIFPVPDGTTFYCSNGHPIMKTIGTIQAADYPVPGVNCVFIESGALGSTHCPRCQAKFTGYLVPGRCPMGLAGVS